MNVILLSGGSGTRLWPLSNDVRSKQFLKIFANGNGSKESMAQRMFRMIREVDPRANIVVATSQNQVPQIQAQLGADTNVCVEPCRRDTFPAIALASAYLSKQGISRDESVVVCPVDPYVEIAYFECLKRMGTEAGKANLTLMGIEPTEPSEKFGYIIPKSSDAVSAVSEFKEKPDAQTAQSYIDDGALWNGGVFAYKLGYVLDIALKLLGSDDYDTLLSAYADLPKISFDYAVVEKEPSINVVRFAGMWEDLGTWDTFTQAMDDPVGGRAVAVDCTNTHVINELGLPLVVLDIHDSVVAVTPDGMLVSSKERSSELKNYVESQRPMYERRQWGEYRALDYKLHEDGQNSLVKELVIAPGSYISYQRHQRRTEVWTFTEGTGQLVLDGVVRTVGRGDVAVITPGMLHAIRGLSELHIIEVQIGDELVEEDIERFDWDWES